MCRDISVVMASSPDIGNDFGYFINHIDDSPDLDLTVHGAIPVSPGGLLVPTPTWRSTDSINDNSEGNSNKNGSGQSNSQPSKSSTCTSPTVDLTKAPEFPLRRSSADIIAAIESANGNKGMFYRRAAVPANGQSQGKVGLLRKQFEKIEREKIEEELIKESAARKDGEKVPIYV